MAPKRPLSSQVPPAKRMRGSNGSNPSPKDAIIILDEERDSVFGKYIDLTADEPFTPPRSSCKATSKSFRFMDLPAELRVSVYRCLLPSGMKIQFRRRHADNVKQRSQQNFVNGWVWNTIAWDKSGTQYGCGTLPIPQANTSLFLVNKFMSNEARAVLYGENTFAFSIDDYSHFPVSLRSPEIFAIFGTDIRLPLLRNFRSIEMVVQVSRDDFWGAKRHRGRLEHFINILKEHSDDEDKKSLLKHLRVKYQRGYEWYEPSILRMSRKYALESLAALNGIEEVEIEGNELPDWYKKCLQLCINGKGGDVLPVDYPDIQIKKRKNGFTRRYVEVWQSTKAWYMPALNWEEYAERNGVEIPPDVVIDLSGD